MRASAKICETMLMLYPWLLRELEGWNLYIESCCSNSNSNTPVQGGIQCPIQERILSAREHNKFHQLLRSCIETIKTSMESLSEEDRLFMELRYFTSDSNMPRPCSEVSVDLRCSRRTTERHMDQIFEAIEKDLVLAWQIHKELRSMEKEESLKRDTSGICAVI